MNKLWKIFAREEGCTCYYDEMPTQHPEYDDEPKEGVFLTNDQLDQIRRECFEAARSRQWNYEDYKKQIEGTKDEQ